MPKGVYVRTAEARANIAAVMLGKKRGPYSAEHCAKIAAGNRGKVTSVATRQKQRAAKLLNPTRYWLGKSGLKLGATQSAGARARNAESNKRSYLQRDHSQEGKKRFNYNGKAFRSSYEVRCVKVWDALGVTWIYEPRVFRLSDGTLYQPEFYHPESDYWTEVKGFFPPTAQRKVELFQREISARLQILRLEHIEVLEHQVELIAARRVAKGA